MEKGSVDSDSAEHARFALGEVAEKSPRNSEEAGRLSDSSRPSRSDRTRCIEEASAASCVTSTRVVP